MSGGGRCLDGCRGFFRRGARFKEGDHASAGGGENHTDPEAGLDGTPATGGWVGHDGHDGIHHGCTGEDDGHDDGGRTFRSEGEQHAECADGPHDAGDEGPNHASLRHGPRCAGGDEHGERGEDCDEEVGDSDEEEGFVATVDGIPHVHLAVVEEYAVHAPGCDGQECECEPGDTGLGLAFRRHRKECGRGL